jgi:hypothetical protein
MLIFLFSECIKLLGFIRSITFRFSFLDSLYVLYHTCTLVRFELEYALVAWNSIRSTDSAKLERIQKKFAPVCFYRFFPHVTYSYASALEKLGLHTLSLRRHLFMHSTLFRFIAALNPAPPFWKMLVFAFLHAMF